MENNIFNEFIESILKRYKVYQDWEGEVSKQERFEETVKLVTSREYLLDHEYDYVDKLIDLDYLVFNSDNLTFKLGLNKANKLLRDISNVFTEKYGVITNEENDYYEVSKQLGILVLEYIKNLSGIEIINEEQGGSIIERYGEYGFSEEDEGSYIFICEEGMYITIENHSYSECNVEEFETLEEAIKWLN